MSTTSAPTMSAARDGTVSWGAISGVSSYVFVRKVPGLADQYSIVNGTSVKPPAVPGKTVSFGVRTNVRGSVWAREVSIFYASAPEPTPPPSTIPAPPPGPVTTSFETGIVAGSALLWELPFIQLLDARSARMEFSAGTSAASMAPTIDAYARAGIRPLLLAGFAGDMPTHAEALNIATWAAAYGPGGTFWTGKNYPVGVEVRHIEWGNETSYSYQFSDNSLAVYEGRARAYAQSAYEAARAIELANHEVRLLVQGDNAVNGTAWVTNMLKVAPFNEFAAGWTIHPYGPNWATRIDSTINSAGGDLPIFVTEWGLSSDNGRALDDNYGFNKAMEYGEAANTLRSVVHGMESRYGSRLGGFFLYQAHDQYATGTRTGREAYFGALQSNKEPKGDYTVAAKEILAAL